MINKFLVNKWKEWNENEKKKTKTKSAKIVIILCDQESGADSISFIWLEVSGIGTVNLGKIMAELEYTHTYLPLNIY